MWYLLLVMIGHHSYIPSSGHIYYIEHAQYILVKASMVICMAHCFGQKYTVPRLTLSTWTSIVKHIHS